MARKKSNEILVGLFTMAGVTCLLALVFVMGGVGGFWQESTEVRARFRDVQGLQPGDPVYLFGLKVGKVTDLRLLPRQPKESSMVEVAMSFPRRYREYLHTETRVAIGKSLTGIISVLIEDSPHGAGDPFPETDSAFLVGVETADFARIADEANSILVDGKEVVASLSRMLRKIEEEGNLRATLSDVAATAKDVREQAGPMLERVDAAVKSLSAIAERLDRLVEENHESVTKAIRDLADTSSLAKGFVERLEKTPERLDSGLASVERVANRVEHLLRDNRTNIDVILEDLRKTVSNAELLTAEIKRRPWRLLYQPDRDEVEALGLYDAAWAYNLASTELHRSLRLLSDRLEAVTGSEDREGREAVGRAIAQVRLSLGQQHEVEEAFWKRLDEAE